MGFYGRKEHGYFRINFPAGVTRDVGLLGCECFAVSRDWRPFGKLLGPIGWVVLFFLPKGLRPQNIGYSVVVILLVILALLVINALVR